MARLVSTSWPQRIRNTDVQGARPAKSEILAWLAGYARWLAEYVTGSVPSGQDACAPFTAIGGGVGHDHSGGVMGVPLKHVICWWRFGYPVDQAVIVGGVGPRNQVDSATTTRTVMDRILIGWVPAGKIYATGKMVVSVRADAACSVTIDVEHRGHTSTATQVLVANTTTHVEIGDKVPLFAGKDNAIILRVNLTYTSATANCTVLSAGLHQTSSTP